MKFSKDFERDLVPEWRDKYMGYKEEEKRLKLLVSAFRDMNYRSQNGAASFGNITHSLAGHHNRTSTSRQYIQPHGATYGSIASPGRLRELQRLKLLDQRPSSDDVPLMHYQPLERREQEYVQWLEQQLDKVQSFYTEKVQGMGNRLDTLRLQLRLILIGLIILIMLCPLRIFHYSSRRWFAYSYLGLTMSGRYSVEFRDFFLGNQLCSEAYSFGNIALLSCIYRSHWDDPERCNSSHSRLLGFMITLPA